MVKVIKSLSERFVLKSDDPHWWASITISPDGFLDIQSDYGSYSYRWGSFGDDFKAFLVKCDRSYILGKFGMLRTEFSLEKTLKVIKEDVLRARRGREISREEARDFWWRVGKGFFDCMSPDIFMVEFTDAFIFRKVYGGDPTSVPFIREDDPAACAFMDKIWPHFIEELKRLVL